LNLVQAIEIFAAATGVAYAVLEILQKNAMWVVGILTGLACAYSFGVQHLWASMGLNIYYVGASVWGLVQWRRDSIKSEGEIHLARPSIKVLIASTLLLILGTLALTYALVPLGDAFSAHDAFVTVLSVIGTWWLVKSYPQQWLIWIVADVLSAWLCLRGGMYWMTALYLAYAGSAVYGYIHWKKKGIYI
jgi:nicotinamide mononucleotide transporter